MIKVKIVFDEEKILKEKNYNLEKIWNAVDAAFLSKNIQIEGKGLYAGTDQPQDFANFGLVCVALGRSDWFLPVVKEWRWYNNEVCEDKNQFAEDDLLQGHGMYKVGFR